MSPRLPPSTETGFRFGSDVPESDVDNDKVDLNRRGEDHGDVSNDERRKSNFPPVSIPQWDTVPRDIIKLYQCSICSLPFSDPITLPCGNSMCRKCIPETHTRLNITYPGLPDRLEGFICPFERCAKEHALGDCGIDVILNKSVGFMREAFRQGDIEARNQQLSTPVRLRRSSSNSSTEDDSGPPTPVDGGRLLATWTTALAGRLDDDTDIIYEDGRDPDLCLEDIGSFEQDVLKQVQSATRGEMDCQVCYALYYDPLTTACGHTFCRNCLHRILDHSRYCPICRRQLTINPLLNRTSCPSNSKISKIIETYWADDVKARGQAISNDEELRLQDFDIPLFVCTVAFPTMPTFLHVFEPRYRLMIRRALDGDRTFGMVMPKNARSESDAHFRELGVLLRIVNVQFYPDGRSLIETVGLSRIRVQRHGWLDGYTVGKTERIDDISLEEEEAREAAEVTPRASPLPGDRASGSPTSNGSRHTNNDRHSTSSRNGSSRSNGSNMSARSGSKSPPKSPTAAPTNEVDLDAMTTKELMEYCTNFVSVRRRESVPWLAERLLTIYGDCPNDAALFPWWFGSVLPLRDHQKYRLLDTSSVRQRLKVCALWIMEMETHS